MWHTDSCSTQLKAHGASQTCNETTLEATPVVEFSSQSPTDANRLWWHFYGSRPNKPSNFPGIASRVRNEKPAQRRGPCRPTPLFRAHTLSLTHTISLSHTHSHTIFLTHTFSLRSSRLVPEDAISARGTPPDLGWRVWDLRFGV